MSPSVESPSTSGSGARALVARQVAVYPETWAVVLTAAVWAGLVAAHFLDHERVEEWTFSPWWWVAMTVAMMAPTVLPQVRRLAIESLWDQRHRSGLAFLVAYLGVWIGFGLLGGGLLYIAASVSDRTVVPDRRWLAVSLVAAAAWQFTTIKYRSVRACHLREPVAARGRRRLVSAARYGAIHGGRCVRSCGPVMGAMLVSAHDVHLMVPLSAVLLYERHHRQPDLRIGAAVLRAGRCAHRVVTANDAVTKPHQGERTMPTAQRISAPLRVDRLENGSRQLVRDLVIDLGIDLGLGNGRYDCISLSEKDTTVVTVPAGFETDFSSIPRFARALYRFDSVDLAGCCHDLAYEVGVPRAKADRIWEIVATSGTRKVGRVRGWLGWAALRIGGWAAYKPGGRALPEAEHNAA